MKASSSIIILLLSLNVLYGQSDLMDSLEVELSRSEGTIRIDILNAIGMKLIFNDQPKALNYSKIAIDESRRINYLSGEISGIYIQGIVNDINGIADSSEYYFDLGYRMSKENRLNQLEARGLNNLGMMNWNRGNFDKALGYFLNALSLHEKNKSPKGISTATSNIGLIYQELKQFDKALEYNYQSLATRLKDKNYDHIARSYNNIGICHKNLEKYDSAVYYYEKGIEYAVKGDSEQVHASILDNLANIYDITDEHEKSIEYHLKSLRMKRNRDSFGHIASHDNLSSLYNEIGHFEMALYHANKSDSIVRKVKAFGHGATTYRNKAEAYLQLSQKDSVKKYLILWSSALDSVYGENSAKAVADMETKYKTEKKEKEIEILTAKSKIQELELENVKYLILVIAIASFLIIVLIMTLTSRRNYKLKASLSEEKEKQQKLRFKAVIEAEEAERKRIAQELHDGLGQILSTARLNVSVLEEHTDSGYETQVSNSLKLIDNAVNEVRTISHNMMPNALISIGFEAALREQTHLINDANQVKLHLSLPDAKLAIDESKAVGLYRIIQEILNNALKYAEADNIWIDVKKESDSLIFEIRDDGKGFDTTLLETSSGIGWSNIISRADILDGTLKIESTVGEGSFVSLKMAV